MSGRRHAPSGEARFQENNSSRSAAKYKMALRHFSAGHLLKAIKSCEQVLALEATHSETLHLMGLISLQDGQLDAALEWISRALRSEPRVEYVLSLGQALQQLNRHDDALKAFDKAVQLQPDDGRARRCLGDALANVGRNEEALSGYQQALKLNPSDWDAADKRANLLRRLGRMEEALAGFDACDKLRPDQLPTLNGRLACLCGLRRFDEALATGLYCKDIAPDNPDVWNDIGAVLQWLGRDGEALEYFDRAIRLRPDFAHALFNKAASLTKVKRFDDALTIYDHLRANHPDDGLAAIGRAQIQLLTGDFEQGWRGREQRWKKLSTGYPPFSQPMWLGKESIAGKTLLIGADEGFGDSIQFVRYAPMAAAMGARVILVVQDALHPVLSGLEGIAQCIPFSASKSLPPFDFHTPTTSLPLAFGTTVQSIPAPLSYLPRPDQARIREWESRLGAHSKLRVGLVWSGNPRHVNDCNRSMPLKTLLPALDVEAMFISLQKEPRTDDRALLGQRSDIFDPTEDFVNFEDTAALICCLDLVVTVDTSVAHLAGALGRPTWLLLPFVPDFRWLLDREDSPWYPSMRLFRQARPGDYDGVIECVRASLLEEISRFSQSS